MISTRGLPYALALAFIALWTTDCGDHRTANPDVAGLAGMPIHLEDRLDSAEIEGAEVHADLAMPASWTANDGLGDWRALPNFVGGGEPVRAEKVDDVLRLLFTERCLAPDDPEESLHGGIYLDVQNFVVDSWREVEVTARISGPVQWLGIGYDLREAPGAEPREQWPTQHFGAGTGANPDGAVHTYRFGMVGMGGPVPDVARQITLEFGATGPAQIDVLSIALEPAAARFADAGVGVRSVLSTPHEDFGPQRRVIYVHSPARISYPLRVPEAGRLDLALGSLAGTSRMSVRVDYGDSTEALLDESVPPGEAWHQHSLDLSKWAGRDITLSLVADVPPEADAEPSVAFWASPTVSGGSADATSEFPNVVFYVIDGASAYLMSVYGYERPTTPNLQALAGEGVVFEQAHSNATWTMPSTASFMTSLHHSVLGGLKNDANPIPPNVKTMAEHFHDAGFHTGVFTFNPNAGGLSGLDRAADVFRDFGKRGDPLDPIEAISSQVLQAQFWRWRDAYPGPYWVHFQTTDVHPPHHPQDPFAGRYVPKEESEALASGMVRMRFPFNHTSASVHEHWQDQLRQHGYDPHEFYSTMLDMHDEAMLHQDHQIGELVKELKSRGEWQNTLLVIGSDHGHPAASYPRFGRGLLDPQPEPWEGALLGEFESHVPLLFVWPGRIEGGRRVEHPVSMIDVLPTILDLVGLPQPEIAQGRSLAPLLLRNEALEPRPVILEEFRVADDGSMIGNLEILDGRWGRSLEIRSADLENGEPPSAGRHPAPAGGRWKALPFADVPRLLIYDVEADPRAIEHVADPDAEFVEESERRLWRLWKEHQALAAKFEAGEEAELSPEQVEALKALGYVE